MNLQAHGDHPPFVWSFDGTPTSGFQLSADGHLTSGPLHADKTVPVMVTDAKGMVTKRAIQVNVPLVDGGDVCPVLKPWLCD